MIIYKRILGGTSRVRMITQIVHMPASQRYIIDHCFSNCDLLLTFIRIICEFILNADFKALWQTLMNQKP